VYPGGLEIAVGFMKRTLWATDALLRLSKKVRIKLLEPVERPEFISRLLARTAGTQRSF
jgi:hypothetical protein